MNFEQTPEFSKELKRFSKKWRSIEADLKVLQKAITLLYVGDADIPAQHIRETFFATKKGAIIQSVTPDCEVVKIRMDSTDVNKDMLRVTFVRVDSRIIFVELYAKNDKAREDIGRIRVCLKSL